MGKDTDNARHEFAAIILQLAVIFPLVIAPAIILILVAKPPNASSLYKYLIIFFVPQLIAFLTHGIMGLEVNKKVKRVDMLEGGLANFMVIWKTYYYDIAKHKRVPIVFILFVSSVSFVAAEYAWFFVRSKGIMGVILLLLIVVLLATLRYYLKKYNLQKMDEKK